MATYDEHGRLEEGSEETVEDPQGVLEGNPKPRRRLARKAARPATPPPPPAPEEEEEEPVVAVRVSPSETVPSPPPAVKAEKYVKPSELVSKSVLDRWPAVIEHLRRSGRDAGDCTISVKRVLLNNFNQEPLELMPFDGALVAGTPMVPPGDAIVNFITDAYHTTCPTPAKYTLTFRYKVRPQNENNPYICTADLSLASAAEIAMHRRASSEAYKRAAAEAAVVSQPMPPAAYPITQGQAAPQQLPQPPLAQQLAGLLGMGAAAPQASLSAYGAPTPSEPDPTQLTILELLKTLIAQATTPKPLPELPKPPTFEQELQKMAMFIKMMRDLNPPQPVVTPPPAAQAPAPAQQAPKDPWQETLKFLRGQAEMKKELKKLGLGGKDEDEEGGKEEAGPEKPFEVLETGGMRIPYKEGMSVVSMEFLQNYAILNPELVVRVVGGIAEKFPALGMALAQQLGGAVGMGAPPVPNPNPNPAPRPMPAPPPQIQPPPPPREKEKVASPAAPPPPVPPPATPKPGFRPAV